MGFLPEAGVVVLVLVRVEHIRFVRRTVMRLRCGTKDPTVLEAEGTTT